MHLRGHERTSFDYLVTGCKVGEPVTLDVMREGQELQVRATTPYATPP